MSSAPSRSVACRARRAPVFAYASTCGAESVWSASLAPARSRNGQITASGSGKKTIVVEVPGRLIGEHDRRTPDEGPSDRNPLALPAGKLGGLEGRARGEADPFERLIGAPVPFQRLRRRRRATRRR